MISLNDALDRPAPSGLGDLGGSWDRHVLEALSTAVDDSEERDRVAQNLTRERSWALLSWAEGACSWAVRSQSTELLYRVLQSLGLLDGNLGQRDLMVVATLARRAAQRLDTSFEDLVSSGHPDRDAPLPAWIFTASVDLPSTHVEIGDTSSFEFRRKPPTFDPTALEKLLRDDRE